MRLLVADLVGEATIRESIATLREDIADLAARLDTAEAMAETLPHRRKYLLLSHQLSRRLLEVHLGVDREDRARARSEGPQRRLTSRIGTCDGILAHLAGRPRPSSTQAGGPSLGMPKAAAPISSSPPPAANTPVISRSSFLVATREPRSR